MISNARKKREKKVREITGLDYNACSRYYISLGLMNLYILHRTLLLNCYISGRGGEGNKCDLIISV